jgi:hypothetical protein
MAKGLRGESCHAAIRTVLKVGEIVTYTELYKRIKKRGTWKDETVWQNMMSVVVNLPPARRYWEPIEPFLFLHPDGRYEVYDSQKHPQVIE